MNRNETSRACAQCGIRFVFTVHYHAIDPAFEMPSADSLVPQDWICPTCTEAMQPRPELDDYEYALRNMVG